ncbi:hypothetical protein BJY04DRAFT_44311 [Aspergillus karnatakaensis]|uniref:uncharacterized protein n=1 Tax=Aspergillus karnatakaensis TaxID=1810916 RepID=UPI003CCD2AF2
MSRLESARANLSGSQPRCPRPGQESGRAPRKLNGSGRRKATPGSPGCIRGEAVCPFNLGLPYYLNETHKGVAFSLVVLLPILLHPSFDITMIPSCLADFHI